MPKRKNNTFFNCTPIALSALAILCSTTAQAAKVEVTSEFEIADSVNSCNLESKISTSKPYKLNISSQHQRKDEFISSFGIAVDGRIFNGTVSADGKYTIIENGSDTIAISGTILNSKELDGYYQTIFFNPIDLIHQDTFNSIEAYVEIGGKKKQKAEILVDSNEAMNETSGYYLKLAGILKDRGVITTIPSDVAVFPNQQLQINYTVLLQDNNIETHSVKIPSGAAHQKVYLPFDKISKKIKKVGIKNFHVNYSYATTPDQSNPTAGNVYYSLTLMDDQSGWFGGVEIKNGQVTCDESKLPVIDKNTIYP